MVYYPVDLTIGFSGFMIIYTNYHGLTIGSYSIGN
jgi:hypothetical protein